jgi:organic radical activating enzyme
VRIRINEIFTSIEGEGIYIGTKTLFVRLAGCPLRCFYCDTPYALSMSNGKDYSIEDALHMIKATLGNSRNVFKVNFTGGEPLLQHLALYRLAELIKSEMGLRTYLESSCFDAERFAYLLPLIDICKVEFKLKDANAVADSNHYTILLNNALRCLKYAIENSKVTYIKVVASKLSKREELEELAEMIFGSMKVRKEDIRGFVLQPVHGINEPSLEHMLSLYDAVYPYYEDVRIIPQLHKVMGIP